jgi:8-amino-7-oxononanoate synthase
MGTLGKAAGVAGAFVAADAQVIDYLVQTARPYIYTTAAPPAIAYALLTSLKIIGGAEGQARRAHVQALIAQLRAGLNLQGWRLMPSITPIQPIVIGENAAAMQVAAQLHQQGFWIPAIRPPTVPAGTARLRLSLSASHTQEDVQELIDCLNAMNVEMNVEMSLEKTDASL